MTTTDSDSDTEANPDSDSASASEPESKSELAAIESALPCTADELTLPDLYIALEIDLLAPGDGVITDRHDAAPDRYQPENPNNQIGGQISPFTLSGWLRRGCEEVIKVAGGTACHPGTADANFQREEVYERDLDDAYHEKGSCVPSGDEPGCVIHELFGGFGGSPGQLLRRPVSFSPVRRKVDVLNGEAEAHYRQLSTQVRSRNDADGGQPLRHANRDVLGNIEGTWLLTLRSVKPEFIGLLLEAVTLLDSFSDDFDLQLGGARNFGAGMADCRVLNPLYTDTEIRRVFDRGKSPTLDMDQKDERWRRECRDWFVEQLQERLHDDAEKMGVERTAIVGATSDSAETNNGSEKTSPTQQSADSTGGDSS